MGAQSSGGRTADVPLSPRPLFRLHRPSSRPAARPSWESRPSSLARFSTVRRRDLPFIGAAANQRSAFPRPAPRPIAAPLVPPSAPRWCSAVFVVAGSAGAARSQPETRLFFRVRSRSGCCRCRMTDLRIPEALLYMDYLVGVGTGWRVAWPTRRAQGPPPGGQSSCSFSGTGCPGPVLPPRPWGCAGSGVAGAGLTGEAGGVGALGPRRPGPATASSSRRAPSSRGAGAGARALRAPCSRTPGTLNSHNLNGSLSARQPAHLAVIRSLKL